MDEARKIARDIEPALRRFDSEAVFVDEVKDDGSLVVRGRNGTHRAQRAISCLVEPRPGDTALVAASTDGQEVYVLAILRRIGGAQDTEISAPGVVRLKAEEIELVAADGIRLMTPTTLETSAETMIVRADDAKVMLKSLAYLGREIAGHVRAVKVVGEVLDGAWESVRQNAKRLYRTTSEVEQIEARSRHVRCEQLLTMQADTAAVTAEKLIKMDAGQILMG